MLTLNFIRVLSRTINFCFIMNLHFLKSGRFISWTLFLLSISCVAQNKKIDSFLQLREFKNARKIVLESYEIDKDSNAYYNRIANINLAQYRPILAIQNIRLVDSNQLSMHELAIYYRSLGQIYRFSEFNDESAENFRLAQITFEKSKDFIEANRINIELWSLVNMMEFSFNYDHSKLHLFYQNATRLKDTSSLILSHLKYWRIDVERNNPSIHHLNKALQYALTQNDTDQLINVHGLIGTHYEIFFQRTDSAEYHYDQVTKLARKSNDRWWLYRSYFYRNNVPMYSGNSKNLIFWYKKVDHMDTSQFSETGNDNLILSNAYKKLTRKESTEKYVVSQVNDSLSLVTINAPKLTFNEWESNKEAQFTVRKALQQRKFITVSIIILLISAIIFLLIITNIKKKKREIEIKNSLLLKQQEISSIDAMIEGQEKERQRIANDLHDNLGGLLATLKLYVQNLKIKKNRIAEQHEIMLQKTDEILEEAYQKVRSIAHTQNAGVLSSERLIPAVKNFAAKVSASNKLIVEVEDHGMKQRLGNSLEIGIFRIIQELITNVINHAKASQTIIHLTNHEHSINILVEDDGIGFDINTVKSKGNMGLSSIRKRVESLNGKIDIDSVLNKGTNVIIDIPLI